MKLSLKIAALILIIGTILFFGLKSRYNENSMNTQLNSVRFAFNGYTLEKNSETGFFAEAPASSESKSAQPAAGEVENTTSVLGAVQITSEDFNQIWTLIEKINWDKYADASKIEFIYPPDLLSRTMLQFEKDGVVVVYWNHDGFIKDEGLRRPLIEITLKIQEIVLKK